MKNTFVLFSPLKRLQAFSLAALFTLAAATLGAQTPASRISAISDAETTLLKGSMNPRAQAQYEAGRMPSDTRLSGISMVFRRSAAQEADLQALLAAQQNPASPLYHQWLTPDQFAARFGMSDADLAQVQTWVEQHGFSVDSVSRGHNMVRFSGTVRQVEQAFQTEMHYYSVGSVKHFAPSKDLSIPSAMVPVVAGVTNLDDFRPTPMLAHSRIARPHARPGYTYPGSSGTASDIVFFAPGDIKAAYDFPSTGTGYTGTGQSIAIVGQSAILNSDIETFETLNGLPTKDPTLMLVPNTGSSVTSSGDESESDLDVEWSGATAPGASIIFVYTGSNTNYGVFDALNYAIDNNVAPIISVSYGGCEFAEGQTYIQSEEQILAQGATQGQTIFAASGDTGSTGCFGLQTTPALTTAQQQQLAVSYPASSAYVVAVGGTETPAADDVVGQYWSGPASTSSPALTTALGYIPETAWNDDALSVNISPSAGGNLSASGGGASIYIARPSWQQQGQAPGIPSGSFRLVPDVALYSSPDYPGYLYCSSDSSAWQPSQQGYPAQQGSCTSGFLDSTGYWWTAAGGTSFASPIFAGMVAVLNQAKGYGSKGQGLINSTLYSLANSAAYNTVFHDVTTGNNFCTAGTAYSYCSSSGATEGFAAGTGYDEVTGLGSVDLNSLVGAWAASTGPTLITTTTTVAASSTSPTVNQTVTFTVTVTAADKSTPQGNISLTVDGGTAIAETLGSNGTVVYTTSFATSGSHVITVQYPANGSYAASSGSVTVNVQTVSSGKGTFTVAASPSTLAVSQGASGTETITVTPASGYTGTVLLSLSTSSNALGNLCYDFPNITTSGDGPVAIDSTSAASTTLTLDTNAADCASGSSQKGTGKPLHRLGPPTSAKNNGASPLPAGIAFAGLLLFGFLGRYSRKFSALAGLFALVAIGLSVSACGGGGNSVTVTNPPKGTYTITVTGQDSASASITGNTTFTFTIQ